MFKLKFFIAIITVSFFFAKANAQVDTSYFDLGHLRLKKDFTQSITVKGEDLEKMPFENLSDAINVWFYGSYTNTLSVVYVIDGNLVNDVNAYSIYDINEVTLVQNAVTKLNGAVGPQQLILIKTKRAKNKGIGVTANAQANISRLYTNSIFNTATNTYETGQKSPNTLYEQYNISAFKNTGNINFGISADYMRDALPIITQSTLNYPTLPELNKFKFNGYFNTKIGNSVLDITSGYVPQKDEEVYNDVSEYQQTNVNYNLDEHIWNTAIKLTTLIAPGFTNVLHGDYNYYGGDDNEEELDTYTNSTSRSSFTDKFNNHDIVAYDNISYDAKFGRWNLEPAVNLTFRTFRDSSSGKGVGYDQYGDPVNNSSFEDGDHEHMFLLTPSLNLYYKSYFSIQGGIMDNLATIGGVYPEQEQYKKVLPFVTASADVAKLINPNSSLTIKIFGSYSLAGFQTDKFTTMPGLNSSTVELPVLGSVNNAITMPSNAYGNLYTYNSGYLQLENKTYKTISAGLSVSPQKSGITFSYFFEKANYLSAVYEYAPAYGNEVQTLSAFDNTNSILNSLSLRYNLVNKTIFSWQTAVNATMLRQKYDLNYGAEPTLGADEWTGGWVNRLKYRDFFAGADVLYRFGEKTYASPPPDYNTAVLTKVNSFSLQNLYFGYTIKAAKFKNLDVFVNARNIFQNQKEDITDSRKYYGLGLKLSL